MFIDRGSSKVLTMAISNVLFSSDKDYWETPQKLFDELNNEFNFNLDPCSTHENAKCENHFTIQEDGLAQNWGGTMYSAIPHMERNQHTNGLKNAITSR